MNFRIALCNEVLGAMPFPAQCAFAAACGYDGLEVAPYTLGPDPLALSPATIASARRAAADAGIAITGLHWLLVKPEGLSVTSDDDALRERTHEAMKRLVGLCAELGGHYLVHGSPAQRRVPAGTDRAIARDRLMAALALAANAARAAGVTYLLEPLPRDETDLVNTLDEAAAIVREIGSPSLATMIDAKSAALTEREDVAALARRWLPTGLVRHVQLNDRNRRGPGQGDDHFAPLVEALVDAHYAGVVAIEPFEYVPDGPACAARAIGYVRGLLERTASG